MATSKVFFLNANAAAQIYTLSLHDALPISGARPHRRMSKRMRRRMRAQLNTKRGRQRSEEHTSELQSRRELVCRRLLEKKKLRKVIQRGKFFVDSRIDDRV